MFWNAPKKERRSLLERLVIIENSPGEKRERMERYDPEDPNLTVVTVSHVGDGSLSIPTPVAPENALRGQEISSINLEVIEPAASNRPAKNTYFDILERAKEAPDNVREEIHLTYVPPKRVHDAPVREPRKKREARTYDISEIEGGALAPKEKEEIREVLEEEIGQDIPETVAYREPVSSEGNSYASDLVASILGEAPERVSVSQNPDEVPPTEDTSAPRVVPVARYEDEPINTHNPITGEPMRIQRTVRLDKIIFPEEYFYAKNGQVFKTAEQLKRALEEMDEETFHHHAVARNVNDFANWIQYVFEHTDCAERISQTKDKMEMARILQEYL